MLAKAFNFQLNDVLSDSMIKNNSYGKPEFIENGLGFFSISHSGRFVVLAKYMRPISVDIEVSRMISEEKVNYIFNKTEQNRYLSLSKKEGKSQEILKLWTMKEAALKLLGTGLYINPKEVNISGETCRINGYSREIKVKHMKLKSCVCSLATYDESIKVIYHEINEQDNSL